METISQKFQEVVAVGEQEAMGLGGNKVGLAECRDMDRQLAQAASAKFGDIHLGILDEIFQNVCYPNLVGIRRVRKGWNIAISRKNATFHRTVVIHTDSLSSDYWWMMESFWGFANAATTLVICGNTKRRVSYNNESDRYIFDLWRCYTGEHDRPHRINKVIYANIVIRSHLLRCAAVLKVGFETVLYNCSLWLVAGNIFRYDRRNDEGCLGWDYLDIDDSIRHKLEVVGPHTYSMNAADLKKETSNRRIRKFDETDESENAVVEHFAKKSCTRLEDIDLSSLTENYLSEDDYKGFRKLVEQLINRLDRENEEALDLFKKGDVTGFLRAAHPLNIGFRLTARLREVQR